MCKIGKQNFILVSMEDKEIKRISNVISNDSCRRILDYLANKDATESELAEILQIPISTVHYNLQQLIETNLITVEEFHYSKRGKEVNHYKLANKYIIISPKRVYGIKEKLRSILPVVLVALITAGIIQLFSNYLFKNPFIISQNLKAVESTAQNTADSVQSISQAVPEAVSKTVYLLPHSFALWFLIGALFALGLYFIIDLQTRKQ